MNSNVSVTARAIRVHMNVTTIKTAMIIQMRPIVVVVVVAAAAEVSLEFPVDFQKFVKY